LIDFISGAKRKEKGKGKLRSWEQNRRNLRKRKTLK